MKYKIYYIIGIFVIVVVSVISAIFLTSKGKGSVIDIETPPKDKIFRRVTSIILGPKTSQKLYFHKSGWFLKKIEFRLPNLEGTDFQIEALVSVSGKKPKVENWTDLSKKTFCLDRRKEKIKDVVLTINNSSSSTILKEELIVLAMREGCNEWSGNVKYEWTDTNEIKNEQGIAQATFTLKENAYATEYMVADGGYTYNFLGCSKEGQTKTYTVIGDGNLTEYMLRLIPQGDGNYELKFPTIWGQTDKAKEYIKRRPICIYGKESGDTVNTLAEASITTLPEVLKEKIILVPDELTGNLKGKKEIMATLEDGTERKIKISWDLVRQ